MNTNCKNCQLWDSCDRVNGLCKVTNKATNKDDRCDKHVLHEGYHGASSDW